jgi:hypothetical protein
MSVDLPEPFSPHSETTSPALSRRLTLSIAFTVPKVLVMFFISSNQDIETPHKRYPAGWGNAPEEGVRDYSSLFCGNRL